MFDSTVNGDRLPIDSKIRSKESAFFRPKAHDLEEWTNGDRLPIDRLPKSHDL